MLIFVNIQYFDVLIDLMNRIDYLNSIILIK